MTASAVAAPLAGYRDPAHRRRLLISPEATPAHISEPLTLTTATAAEIDGRPGWNLQNESNLPAWDQE